MKAVEARRRRIYPALFALLAIVSVESYKRLLPEPLNSLGKGLMGATLFACAALLVAGLVLAIMSWGFVEQPLRKRDAIMRRRGLFIAAATSMAVFSAVGASVRGDPRSPVALRFGSPSDPRAPEPRQRADASAPPDRPRFAVWGDSHQRVLPRRRAGSGRSHRAGLFFGDQLLYSDSNHVGELATPRDFRFVWAVVLRRSLDL